RARAADRKIEREIAATETARQFSEPDRRRIPVDVERRIRGRGFTAADLRRRNGHAAGGRPRLSAKLKRPIGPVSSVRFDEGGGTAEQGEQTGSIQPPKFERSSQRGAVAGLCEGERTRHRLAAGLRFDRLRPQELSFRKGDVGAAGKGGNADTAGAQQL